MPTGLTTRVIDHLRRAALPRDGAGLGDGELLGCFVERRDEAALAALVERHGPMVWGVCRRLLSHHDAEDAFQAAFLVLVRKASSIRPREMVGNWLYGVAHQTALQARRAAARRRAREVQVTAMPDTEAAQQDLWSDVQPLLDEELSRLPDVYRAVIVLCDLEGRTRKEVASQLGVPEGTVGGRLARARAMLAKRLSQRGVVLSRGALAAALVQNAAMAAPTSVALNTISAASSFATGSGAAGPVSVKVAALTEGVLKAMLMSKLKAVVAIVLLLGFIAAGATALSGLLAARENQPPATEPKVNTSSRPEPELNRPGAALPDLAGTWQGDDWGTVILRPAKDGGFEGTYSDTFGKDVGRIAVRWSAASRQYEGTWSEGTYRFGRIALDAPKDGAISGAYTTDPKCEHQPGVPGLASLKWTKKNEKDDKEDITTWGKEVGGLQAGLSIANRSDVQFGGKATGTVQLRNVSNKTITVSVWPFWVSGPQVVDSVGKRVRSTSPPVPDFEIVPTKLTLNPGQTVVVAKTNIFVTDAEAEDKPFPDGVVDQFTIHVRPGTYRADYSGFVRERPTLATGTVEFKVTGAEKEAFTAWGKEVDGVQAGLGYLPGAKQTYAPGETVQLVVRVRNVGKKDMTFRYLKEFFFENPPTVTNGAGRELYLGSIQLSGEPILKEVNLAPGKEIELCELNLKVRQSREKGKDGLWTLTETGRFQLQYETVGGNIGSVKIKVDTILSKLNTGKLELEVKPDLPPGETEKK